MGFPAGLHDEESSLDVTSRMLVSNCEKEGSFSSVNYNAELQCTDN